MPFIFNGILRTITEQALPGNPAIARYNVLRDLYSAGVDWWDSNSFYEFPFRLEGGGFRFLDSLGNAVYATADLFLQNQVGMGWRIVPANYPHQIEFSGANLLAENPTFSLWDFSSLTAQVVVIPTFSDINTGYATSTGGPNLTAAQVWDYSERTLTSAGAGSGGATLAEIEGSSILAKQSSLLTLLSRLTETRATKLDRDLAHSTDANLYKADLSGIPNAIDAQLADNFAAVLNAIASLPTNASVAVLRALVDEIHLLHGLKAGNPLTVSETVRSAGQITQSIDSTEDRTIISRNP